MSRNGSRSATHARDHRADRFTGLERFSQPAGSVQDVDGRHGVLVLVRRLPPGEGAGAQPTKGVEQDDPGLDRTERHADR